MSNVEDHSMFGTDNYDSKKFGGNDAGGCGMDARVVKIEFNVEYIKRDIGEIKTNI